MATRGFGLVACSRSPSRKAGIRQGNLTGRGIGKGEPDLVQAHDPFWACLVVDLGHCKAVTVLDRAIREGDANDLALSNGLDADNDLVENK